MPRAGLTEDRVVAEAELTADEAGLSKVTLAALAGQLGVRQPSLYKHIESMVGLHRSISIRAKIPGKPKAANHRITDALGTTGPQPCPGVGGDDNSGQAS